MTQTPVEVTGLTVYPVKSMKGIALERASLTPQGLEHDRRFMVVRPDGRFVTQRDEPALALIETALLPGGVQLSRPGFGLVTVPFDGAGGDPVHTRVWNDECETVDQGEVLSRWLTEALESEETLRLVAMAPGFVRPQGKPGRMGGNTHTLFADAAPYLVASEASLDELNRALVSGGSAPVPMNRFRPNIVVRGLEPFREHAVRNIRSDACGFHFCHPCERCVVTTIDQDTARKDPGWQPYRTLAGINPMPEKPEAPAFGHNARLARGAGATINVGDEFQVDFP